MSAIVNERYELVALNRLRVHPRNPRKGDITAIATSIDKNGFYGAVVAQLATGYILAGNHRYLAAKEAGLPEVPVLWVDVDDKTARRILLADNRTSDLASYDDEALVALLRELQAEEDLLGSGFTEKDVDKLIASVATDIDEDEDEEAPPPPEKPESVRGEVYELGPHRLLCGDATCITDVEKLLAEKKVDVVWTDPPYNVDYGGTTRRRLTIANDSMRPDRFLEFLTEAFSTASIAMRPGACFYIAHADANTVLFRLAVEKVGWKLSQNLVWVKDKFALGRGDYHWRHEPILYGWNDGAQHHRVEDRTQDTVWEHKRPRINDEHPTMKPIGLIERAIRNSTDPGDAVLDPFAGSGSTLIAAARTNRVAYLIEIDPRYCDVIRKRWKRHVEETTNASQSPTAAA